MKTVCVIPARGGSARIPRKNIKLFHGKPIIAYSIENAHRSCLFDDVYVSTEDEEIAEVAKQYGAKVIERSKELAENEVGTQDVIRAACLALGLANDDLVLGMYATCPLLPPEVIVEGLGMMLIHISPFCKTVDEQSNDIGAIYWGRSWAFKGGLPLSTNINNNYPSGLTWIRPNNTVCFSLENKYCCDINTMDDWHRAERMYLELHGDKQ